MYIYKEKLQKFVITKQKWKQVDSTYPRMKFGTTELMKTTKELVDSRDA